MPSVEVRLLSSNAFEYKFVQTHNNIKILGIKDNMNTEGNIVRAVKGERIGTLVKVINGPFANMMGKIKTISMETQTLEVALDLFGQETTVELNLSEIEKAL